jgi:hypothetical protein
MNLLEVIHQRWAAAAELNALLPVSNVYTGLSPVSTTPYAVITKLSERPVAYLNDGSVVSIVGLRIEVFDESYDAAAAVSHQVKAAFDRTEFALSGSNKVLNMRRADDYYRQRDDGTWRLAIEFQCTVHSDAAV